MNEQEERRLRAFIEEATQAAQDDDWDRAVDRMRKAAAVTQEPEIVAAGKKNLAMVLYSRAMRTSDKAMTRINEVAGRSDESLTNTRVDLALRSRHARSWILPLVLLALTGFVAWLLYPLFPQEKIYISPFWDRIGGALMLGALATFLIRWGLIKLFDSVSASTDNIAAPGVSPKCWVCGAPAGYRLDVPRHGVRLLCSTHAQRVEMTMQGVAVTDSTAIKLLKSAEADLTEAKDMDPDLSDASDLLTQVRGVLTKLGRS